MWFNENRGFLSPGSWALFGVDVRHYEVDVGASSNVRDRGPTILYIWKVRIASMGLIHTWPIRRIGYADVLIFETIKSWRMFKAYAVSEAWIVLVSPPHSCRDLEMMGILYVCKDGMVSLNYIFRLPWWFWDWVLFFNRGASSLDRIIACLEARPFSRFSAFP